MKERLDKLKKWSRKAGIEIYNFVSSGIFLRNFGGIVGTITLFLILTFWWINCYTRHGESLLVEDYVGMDMDDAIAQAFDNSFEIVINDSTFIPGQDPGIILVQNPKPQSTVKKNRKVYVSVTKKVPEAIALPELRGGNDDYDNFSKKCERKYITTEVSKRVFSNKLEPNTILEVYYNGEKITDKLNGGFSIPKGSTIQCEVTQRGGGTVPIPELVCKKYDAATFLASNFNLSIGSVIADNTVTDQNAAYVWRQVPRYSPSGNMKVGGQIDIYLTQYKPRDCGSHGVNIEAPVPVEDSSTPQEEDFGGGNR
jgi:eukaryotic-like serine/threonine-protein kinase